MIEKQLTIKELIERIGKQKCVSCRGDVEISKTWDIPLCSKCQQEVREDLDQYEN